MRISVWRSDVCSSYLIAAEAHKLKGKAGEKASEYAAVGKEKASDALDGLSRLLQDAAASVDQRLGENYGQYARKTADAISGAAASLREKDLNEVAERSEEHTSELQSLMRISYAVLCLEKKKTHSNANTHR